MIKKGVYNITTKYPYVLGGIITGLVKIGEAYDYTMVTTMGDVITRHSRLQAMDSSLRDLEDIDTFYIFRDATNGLVILTEDYISDIQESSGSGVS